MDKINIPKNNFKSLKKSCACCGKEIEVKLFPDKTYLGGNYFFKVPSEKGILEYWECDSCYK